jgi:hypothetical protein
MTKLITVLIIALFLFGGWHLFFYWEHYKNEEDLARKQAASTAVDPAQLAGMPQQLQAQLQAASLQGAPGLRAFLKNYGYTIQDPRKAWIELDYCVLVAREDPAEARRIFGQVKDRIAPASPVWPRVKQLEKTYQ